MPRYRDLDLEKYPELKWFADNIMYVRSRLNLSQQDFATRCGLSQPYYWALENSKGNPTVEVLSAISQATGIPAADFLRPKHPKIPTIKAEL